jgi:ABC-2 type transport system ATP-binding protein
MYGSSEARFEASRPDATAPAAELRDVTVRFGDVRALDGVTLSIRTGEVTVLLGPNGAGKTTSIRLLLGLARPHAGTTRIFGRDPRSPSARQRTGAMMQLARVPDTLRVGEHIDTFRSYYGAPLSRAELLRITGLDGLERRLYGNLSGGEKQRLMLALALAGDPALLFLDEPSVGMDAATRRQLHDGVRSLRDQGRAILLTTHYLEEADALADRVVVLHHGRVIADGSPADIKRITGRRRVRCVTRLHAHELMRLPGAAAVDRDDAFVIIATTDAENLLRALLHLDPSVHSLEVTGAGLEESFLELTREAVTS